MAEFAECEEMRRRGSSPVDVCVAARAAGMNDIEVIRMLRVVFDSTLAEAKEALLVASGTAGSLREHEEALAAQLTDDLLR